MSGRDTATRLRRSRRLRWGMAVAVGLLLGVIALAPVVAVAQTPANPDAVPPRCGDFRTQADAQVYYRAHRDARNLDADNDGIACESNPSPRDTVPVQVTGVQPLSVQPRPVGNPPQCTDFPSQADAQVFLRANPRNGRVLEAGTDGIACDGNPAPRDTNAVPLRCVDFPSQADAQGYLRANPGRAAALEANADGVACKGNPAPRDTNAVRNTTRAPAPPPPAATATRTVSNPPRCTDFRTQADAQAYLRMNPRTGVNLEAGLGGVACVGNAPPRDTAVVAEARARCGDFRSQAAAQAYLRAVPALARLLEAEADGIACAGNPDPRDPDPVLAAQARTATPPPAPTSVPPTAPAPPTAPVVPPTAMPMPPVATTVAPTPTTAPATMTTAPAVPTAQPPASGDLTPITTSGGPSSPSTQVSYLVRYYALNDSRDTPREMRDVLLANGFVATNTPAPGGIALFLPEYFKNVAGYDAMKRDGLIGVVAAVEDETSTTYRLLVRTALDNPPAEAVPVPAQEGFMGVYELPLGPYGRGHIAVQYFTRGPQ